MYERSTQKKRTALPCFVLRSSMDFLFGYLYSLEANKIFDNAFAFNMFTESFQQQNIVSLLTF